MESKTNWSTATTAEILALVAVAGISLAMLGTSIITYIEQSFCKSTWTVEKGCNE